MVEVVLKCSSMGLKGLCHESDLGESGCDTSLYSVAEFGLKLTGVGFKSLGLQTHLGEAAVHNLSRLA